MVRAHSTVTCSQQESGSTGKGQRLYTQQTATARNLSLSLHTHVPFDTEQEDLEHTCAMTSFCLSPDEGPLWRRVCWQLPPTWHLPPTCPFLLGSCCTHGSHTAHYNGYFFLNAFFFISLQALVVCLQAGRGVSVCFVVQQSQKQISVNHLQDRGPWLSGQPACLTGQDTKLLIGSAPSDFSLGFWRHFPAIKLVESTDDINLWGIY